MATFKQLLAGAACVVIFTWTYDAQALGPDWVEDGDAGANLETAQPINQGEGNQLQKIFGRLTGVTPVAGIDADFEDVYQILVTDPVNLFFSTVGTDTNFQTSLWLFDEDGFGLLGNIFASVGEVSGKPLGSAMGNSSTDDTGIFIKTPGIYYIAICGIGREPTSIDIGAAGGVGGLPIFSFENFGEVSGPDGEGGGNPLSGWTGDGSIGDYEITVAGVGFVPAPAALPLLAIGALGVIGRRRR